MKNDFRIAIKTFVISKGKLLLLKRSPSDPHKPGTWDIPGGRLEIGESPFEGVRRELKEETGLEAEILMPIDVHHFTRDDGQKITMIIFLCKPKNPEAKIVLSSAHTEFEWKKISAPIEKFPEWLHQTIVNYNKIKFE